MTSVTVLRTVGRYEILREVGRGGTAVVYLARQTDLDRSVALKELSAFRAADPAFVERFLRESQLTGSLNHPNIVTVYEYFEHDGTAFIAMEYFERGSLRPLVGELSLAQVVGVLEGLFAGLAHAEKHGIVHRDLKPENVMVSSAGGVKIADFGPSRCGERRSRRDRPGTRTTQGPKESNRAGPRRVLRRAGAVGCADRWCAAMAFRRRRVGDGGPRHSRLPPAGPLPSQGDVRYARQRNDRDAGRAHREAHVKRSRSRGGPLQYDYVLV